MDVREQNACIRFCFTLWKTATECYEMLKTASGEPKLNQINGKVRGYPSEEGKASEKQHQINFDLFF